MTLDWEDLRSLIQWGVPGVAIGTTFLAALVPSLFVVDQSVQGLLQTLVTAQASILAIVVSVTLLATQLVATNYAPRMSTLLLRTDQFRQTFALFIGSITLDVVVYLALGQAQHPLLSGLFYSTLVLFILVLVSVYLFSIEMVSQSIPERLVELFTQTVSVEEYIDKTEAYAESPESNTHPLQPLFRYTMTALSKGEYSAATSALDHYIPYTKKTLTEVEELELLDDSEFGAKEELFGPVLKDHLHLIAQHAAENDESQIRNTAIQGQVEIGTQGIGIGPRSRVTNQALRGLQNTIRDGPYTDRGYASLNQCWKGVGELAEEASEVESSTIMLTARGIVRQRLRSSVRTVEEPGWMSDSLRVLFEHFCEAHANTLDLIGESQPLKQFGPDDLYGDGRQTPPDRVEQLRFCQQALIEFTSVVIEHRIENGRWIPAEANYRRAWQNLVIDTADTGATDLAVDLCEVLIQVAFIENTAKLPSVDRPTFRGIDQADPNEVNHWLRELQTIEEKTDSDVVSQAFANLLSYEPVDPSSNHLIRIGEEEPGREELYQFDVRVDGYNELNTREEYPDALRQLRDKVLSSG
ncbi:DUF2254 family protein [Halorubrum sp. GN12_10-3_MGM]|uniref:DUF2254 family protein n=1 Tax=Halorubrum sp. GN12_10-3_MGM TaxID=2518113 RepID=UPI0010FA42F5|nr:DUF2254 family protein [Halorubrum sp. GN12_10-3_MGM]TKX64315.1 DUF2254 domain-containing protein [Halorubrum sp. GN12_10-3_MGM]